jgi:hypothetical protein
MSIGSRICFDVDIERAAAPPCKREHGQDGEEVRKRCTQEWGMEPGWEPILDDGSQEGSPSLNYNPHRKSASDKGASRSETRGRNDTGKRQHRRLEHQLSLSRLRVSL